MIEEPCWETSLSDGSLRIGPLGDDGLESNDCVEREARESPEMSYLTILSL